MSLDRTIDSVARWARWTVCQIIFDENPQQCDRCGKLRELRPYGPYGEAICVSCATIIGMHVIEPMLGHVLFGEALPLGYYPQLPRYGSIHGY
jgi:hypothetical protein